MTQLHTAPNASPSAESHPRPIRVGVIGFGYWGPNLARNVAEQPETELAAIADMNPDRLSVARISHPFARLTTDIRSLVTDPEIDAVMIATPADTHFGLASLALRNGKHVMVEKPMTTSVAEGEELVKLASEVERKLVVDHTFLFQHDTNVIWDLAPHDISIMLHLLGQPVRRVSAVGARHVDGNVENIAYLTLQFDTPLLAHFHVNWLAPAKVRRTIIGGSRKMLVFDDVEASEKVRIYDAGAELKTREDIYRSMVEYRTGDVVAPKLEKAEALAVECAHFARVVRGREEPLSDGRFGLEVVKVLDAAQRSLEGGGAAMEVRP